MYVHRFRQYLVLSAAVSWISFGLYPFGTPLWLSQAPVELYTWVEMSQLLALFVMRFVGLIGVVMCMMAVKDFLLASDEMLDHLMRWYQVILSWAAPFALFASVIAGLQCVYDFANDRISGFSFLLHFSAILLFVAIITVAARASLYRRPGHARD